MVGGESLGPDRVWLIPASDSLPGNDRPTRTLIGTTELTAADSAHAGRLRQRAWTDRALEAAASMAVTAS